MSEKKALTVSELRRVMEVGGYRDRESDQVLVCRSNVSIGGAAASAIIGASFGFDWDKGKFLLHPADPLVVKSDKQALWDSARDFLYMLSGDYNERKGKRYLTQYAVQARRLLERHGHQIEKVEGID